MSDDDPDDEPQEDEVVTEISFTESGARPDESVRAAIRRTCGVAGGVLLRDLDESPSPVIRVSTPRGDQTVSDDDRYQFLGEIARGAIGVVFKGRDKDLGREVAVKVLRKELAGFPEVVERFIEEAQIEGQLQHPGIAPVYGIGLQEDGRPQFAMKLVKGRTLAGRIEDRADPTDDRRGLLEVLERVCRAMAYAHARGVIHRDLKPSNIMVGSFGEAQVLDWGFAKVLGTEERPERSIGSTVIATIRSTEGSSHSLAGSIMGTPAYMPPEQALGHIATLDSRADVFALGAILCEILTGSPPYLADDPDDLLVMASQSRLQDAHARLAQCGADSELVTLALDCLSPLKGDRPEEAGRVADRLATHLADADERARRSVIEAAEAEAEAEAGRLRLEQATARAQWERVAVRRTFAIATGVMLVILLGGGSWLWFERDRTEQRERTRVAVGAAAEEIALHVEQGRWSDARAALRRAEEVIAAADTSRETRDEVIRLSVSIDERERSATADAAVRAADRDLMAALTELLSTWHIDQNPLSLSHAYSQTLYETLGPGAEPSAETVTRLAARDIASELAFHVDAWAWVLRTRREAGGADWKHLDELARALDPDPTRAEIRDLLIAGDAVALTALAAGLPDTADASTFAAAGHALARQGQHAEASMVLIRGSVRYPSDRRIAVLLADSFENATEPDWSAASRLLYRALSLQPDSSLLRRRLSRALVAQAGKTGWLPKGDWYRDPAVLRRLGKTLLDQTEHEGGRAAYRRAVDLEPGSVDAWVAYATVLQEHLFDMPAASEAFEHAVALAPKRTDLLRRLGATYARAARPDDALGVLETALEIEPESVETLRVKAEVLKLIRKPTDVRDVVRVALALAPDDADLHARIGSAQMLLGAVDDAQHHFEQAIALDPDQPDPWLMLGRVLLTRDDRRAAFPVLEEAARRWPKDGVIRRELAHALMGLGEFELASSTEKVAAILLDGHNFASAQSARESRSRTVLIAAEKSWVIENAVNGGTIDATNTSIPRALAAYYLEHHLIAARMYKQLLEIEDFDAHGMFGTLRRLTAAQCAVGAGTGSARDSQSISAADRARWRDQALAWLRADLVDVDATLDTTDYRVRRTAFEVLSKWQHSALLAAVREPDALARLPADEQAVWTTFWKDVEEILGKAVEGL